MIVQSYLNNITDEKNIVHELGKEIVIHACVQGAMCVCTAYKSVFFFAPIDDFANLYKPTKPPILQPIHP